MPKTKLSFQSVNQLIEHISNFNDIWSGYEWEQWTINPISGYVVELYHSPSSSYCVRTTTLDPAYNGKVIKVKSVYYILTYTDAYSRSYLHLSKI